MSRNGLTGRFRAASILMVKLRLNFSPTRHFASTTCLRTPYTEHVQVPCASSGHITVSLHNIDKHPDKSPLVINLPESPVQDISAVDTYLPRFLHRYPTATIHYRWPQRGQQSAQDANISSSSPSSNEPPQPSPPPPLYHWPIPIHDTLAGYDFLTRTLTPRPTGTNGQSRHQRRAVYIYGRHLGGGLAASLALTESHSHEPMAVRGLLAVNGVYNWTTFLPDHPVNTMRAAMQHELFRLGLDLNLDLELGGGKDAVIGRDLAMMKALMPHLFHRPGDLFDPFASPLLFFHTAGLMVPPSFTKRWKPDYHTNKLVPSSSSSASSPSGSDNIDPYDYVYSDPEDPPPPVPFPEKEEYGGGGGAGGTSATDSDSEDDEPSLPEEPSMAPPARKGYFAFPPRASTLRIPTTLLIYSTPPPPPLPDIPASQRSAMWKKFRNAENSFGSQALGLARLMRRSVVKLEARDRMQWDEELKDPEGEAGRRIETGEVRVGEDGREDLEEVEEMSRQWFEDHLG
ncbi:unnamed protein product [Discula destructiva]